MMSASPDHACCGPGQVPNAQLLRAAQMEGRQLPVGGGDDSRAVVGCLGVEDDDEGALTEVAAASQRSGAPQANFERVTAWRCDRGQRRHDAWP
jgi:hypothetical protein